MADTRTPSYKAILKRFNSSSAEVRQYFELLPKLIEEFPYDVALAYLFLCALNVPRIESYMVVL